MSTRTVFVFVAIALTQAACGSLFGSSTSASGMGAARCVAANAKDYLGQEFDDRIVDEARAHAGAMRSRVVRPGEPVTMDSDPLRLNVELGTDGRIHRLRCG
jgi:hypothetical protein